MSLKDDDKIVQLPTPTPQTCPARMAPRLDYAPLRYLALPMFAYFPICCHHLLFFFHLHKSHFTEKLPNNLHLR